MLMQEIVFYLLLNNLHCVVIVMSRGEEFSTDYLISNQSAEFQFGERVIELLKTELVGLKISKSNRIAEGV